MAETISGGREEKEDEDDEAIVDPAITVVSGALCARAARDRRDVCVCLCVCCTEKEQASVSSCPKETSECRE